MYVIHESGLEMTSTVCVIASTAKFGPEHWVFFLQISVFLCEETLRQ